MSVDCPICTDEDNIKSPICDSCWSEISGLRHALAEMGYELTRQEMVDMWTTQIALEANLYDGDFHSAWKAALNIHVFRRQSVETSRNNPAIRRA